MRLIKFYSLSILAIKNSSANLIDQNGLLKIGPKTDNSCLSIQPHQNKIHTKSKLAKQACDETSRYQKFIFDEQNGTICAEEKEVYTLNKGYELCLSPKSSKKGSGVMALKYIKNYNQISDEFKFEYKSDSGHVISSGNSSFKLRWNDLENFLELVEFRWQETFGDYVDDQASFGGLDNIDENDQDHITNSKIIFQDKFDTFDLNTWQHEITLSGGGNWEFQMYNNRRQNSFVKNNTLLIKPSLMSDYTDEGENFIKWGKITLDGGADADYCTNSQDYGCERQGDGYNYLNPIVSARIRTLKSFSFRYGKVTFQAKMPRGDWLWPAVWMMPKNNAYGSWPASGEIDILESRGNLKQTCNGHRSDVSCVHSTLHWGPSWQHNRYSMTSGEKCLDVENGGEDFSSNFHNFELEWTENFIKTKIDGETIMHVEPENDFWSKGNFPENIFNPWQYSSGKMAPFDQEFYLIINLAVGGTNGYFPDSCDNEHGNKPWTNGGGAGPKNFWEGKGDWLPTWDLEGDGSALQIKNLKVEEYEL